MCFGTLIKCAPNVTRGAGISAAGVTLSSINVGHFHLGCLIKRSIKLTLFLQILEISMQ